MMQAFWFTAFLFLPYLQQDNAYSLFQVIAHI